MLQSTSNGKKEVTGANVLLRYSARRTRMPCITCIKQGVTDWTSSTHLARHHQGAAGDEKAKEKSEQEQEQNRRARAGLARSSSTR